MTKSWIPNLPVSTTVDAALGETTDVSVHEQRVDACPSIIASDAFVVGDIDFSDPIAVRRELDMTTLNGTMFSDEAVAAACRAGTARDLFPNVEPSEDSYEVQVLRDWVEPGVKPIMEIADLEERALFIILHAIHGSTKELREAIESVKDAGIFGILAQANLREPMPRTRMGWPWWYRPRSRQTTPQVGPCLFALLGEH